jgi:large subunit ribosomal protein L13Ae
LYDGIPNNLNKVKKLVIPCALRVVKLAPGRKYSTMGEILNEIGWKNKKNIEENEEKLKTIGKKFWLKKYNFIQKRKEKIQD